MPEKIIDRNCPKCSRHMDGRVLLGSRARRIAAHALQVAAQQFDKDAANAKEEAEKAGAGAHGDGLRRLVTQFEKQAAESRDLAEELVE